MASTDDAMQVYIKYIYHSADILASNYMFLLYLCHPDMFY